MPSEFTIPQIIQYASISQYLAGNDNSNLLQLKSGSIVGDLPGLLYMENYLLQNINNLNSSSPTLRGTAEYVLSLCGKYGVQAKNTANNLLQSPPVITGPSNQSGLVGFTPVFSVTVVSSLPVTFQWFRNSIVIPGATNSSYMLPNAQLTDSGSTFYVRATNAAGSSVSGTAVLTVTQSIIGRWYAGGTDYSTFLAAGTDTVAYSGTFNITDGQPLVVPFPAGQFDFIVVQYPISQSVKTHYANPAGGFDQAAVPGLALAVNTFGGNNYIFSNGSPFGINNASGQITFS